MTGETRMRAAIIEENLELQTALEEADAEVTRLRQRIHRTADKLEALRNLVEMAQHASARTRAGAKNARVYAEEILGILDSKEYLT